VLSIGPSYWIFLMVIRLLRLPMVIDIHEYPRALAKGALPRRRLSPLWGACGAVVISSFLGRWVEEEKDRFNRRLAILELPILVNVFEKEQVAYSPRTSNVLFAGSPGFDQTLQFILDAMIIVWKHHPECSLIVTGSCPERSANERTRKMIQDGYLAGRVELAGYLPRDELLYRYSQASALLIPLFNDVRSKARFPTKFGEYLASSRPVVTNAVGEVPRFFVDSKNAYVCEPDDPALFGRKIIEVLDNKEEAIRVGLAGRRTAEENFHYQNYSVTLRQFIDSITKNAGSRKTT
jgi:glycosyltransferase involved in cell wall biosynthesis